MQAQRLHEAILVGDHSTAAEVLDKEPGTAYIRHSSGDYAIHMACRQVKLPFMYVKWTEVGIVILHKMQLCLLGSWRVVDDLS